MQIEHYIYSLSSVISTLSMCHLLSEVAEPDKVRWQEVKVLCLILKLCHDLLSCRCISNHGSLMAADESRHPGFCYCIVTSSRESSLVLVSSLSLFSVTKLLLNKYKGWPYSCGVDMLVLPFTMPYSGFHVFISEMWLPEHISITIFKMPFIFSVAFF